MTLIFQIPIYLYSTHSMCQCRVPPHTKSWTPNASKMTINYLPIYDVLLSNDHQLSKRCDWPARCKSMLSYGEFFNISNHFHLTSLNYHAPISTILLSQVANAATIGRWDNNSYYLLDEVYIQAKEPNFHKPLPRKMRRCPIPPCFSSLKLWKNNWSPSSNWRNAVTLRFLEHSNYPVNDDAVYTTAPGHVKLLNWADIDISRSNQLAVNMSCRTDPRFTPALASWTDHLECIKRVLLRCLLIITVGESYDREEIIFYRELGRSKDAWFVPYANRYLTSPYKPMSRPCEIVRLSSIWASTGDQQVVELSCSTKLYTT